MRCASIGEPPVLDMRSLFDDAVQSQSVQLREPSNAVLIEPLYGLKKPRAIISLTFLRPSVPSFAGRVRM